MKSYLLFTASGVLVILTSYDSIEHPELLKRLGAKGLTKFIAHKVSVESAKAKYGKHFDVVCQDLHESDDLRVLDYSGERAFKNFSFKELGAPIYYESESDSGQQAKEQPKRKETKVLQCAKCGEEYVFDSVSQHCPQCGGALKKSTVIR